MLTETEVLAAVSTLTTGDVSVEVNWRGDAKTGVTFPLLPNTSATVQHSGRGAPCGGDQCPGESSCVIEWCSEGPAGGEFIGQSCEKAAAKYWSES